MIIDISFISSLGLIACLSLKPASLSHLRQRNTHTQTHFFLFPFMDIFGGEPLSLRVFSRKYLKKSLCHLNSYWILLHVKKKKMSNFSSVGFVS